MTKYILHGGAAKRKTKANQEFFFEITKDLSDPVNVLIICYAMERKVWEEVLEKEKETFSNASPEKVLNWVLASEETDILIEQINKADAIYMHGGNTHILKEYLAKVPDLENLWKDKVVAGSSAGALVLSKYFYENDDNTYSEGLGILDLKTFCHYTAEKSDKLEKLKRFGDDVEVRSIAEEKFFIYEI